MDVDSEEGFVRISGDDGLALFSAREIVKAIARGFNPETAKLLMRADYVLIIVNIEDYASGSKKAVERLRGRVIGANGKSRKLIEELTEAYVSVYGKTVAILGENIRANAAHVAVEKLLSGSPHTNVYHWLEKKRRDIVRNPEP